MLHMNAIKLKSITKPEIPSLAKRLSDADVEFLVQILGEKDDRIRYNAFLLLEANSKEFPITYKHWDELEKKIESSNSYQRSIGLMLIAKNVRWDTENKFSKT